MERLYEQIRLKSSFFSALGEYFGRTIAGSFRRLLFFYVSSQTEAVEKSAEQNLTLGRLAFTRAAIGPAPERFIQTSNPDGSGQSTLPTQGLHPTWSLDASKFSFFAFQSGTYDIYVFNLDGSGRTNLTNTNSVDEFNLSWSVTGKIAYERDGLVCLSQRSAGRFLLSRLDGKSAGQYYTNSVGGSGDKPVAGDYDGDGRTDAAIYRSGFWWILQSSNGQSSTTHFGLADDRLIPADYDGDGKTDLAIFRSGVWYILRSLQGSLAFQFGISKDIPAPAFGNVVVIYFAYFHDNSFMLLLEYI